MRIDKAEMNDLTEIEEIYSKAREYMKESGNPEQWKDNYPPTSLIVSDIEKKRLYTLKENDFLMGVFVFFIGEEEAYRENIGWSSDEKYAVIHHVAKRKEAKNITEQIFSYCLSIHPYVRIDTHRDNLTMQNALLRYGFKYIGPVYYIRDEAVTERIAFDFMK